MKLQFEKVTGGFGIDLWAARVDKWSFIIGHNEFGYSASWKDATFTGKQGSNFIDGSPFASYNQAETACRQTLNGLMPCPTRSIKATAPFDPEAQAIMRGAKRDEE